MNVKQRLLGIHLLLTGVITQLLGQVHKISELLLKPLNLQMYHSHKIAFGDVKLHITA